MSALKKSPRYILVINDMGGDHGRPFEGLGLEVTKDLSILNRDPDLIAAVLFTGGADVSPELYAASPHPTTHPRRGRDIEELAICNRAINEGIPLLGICRGAQLLCVMAGGKLIQDVTGHGSCTHPVKALLPSGEEVEFDVTGDHHQMQFPWGLMEEEEFKVLAWGTSPRSKHYAFDADNTLLVDKASEDILKEPDIIWYPKIKALAMQFHPEWMSWDAPAVNYVRELFTTYITVSKEVDGNAYQA